MKTGIWAVLAVGLMAGGAVFAAPLDMNLVPADAQWVFHVDFDAFRLTQIGQLVLEDVAAQRQKQIDALAEMLGSDLTTDIANVTLFGADGEEENAVALLRGKFDREKLLTLLALNETYATSDYREYTIHKWVDEHKKKNQVGAFAADDVIVISQSEKAVTGFLDVYSGAAGSLEQNKGAIGAALQGLPANAFVAAAADKLADLAQGKGRAAILRNSRFAAFIADETSGSLKLHLNLETESPDVARQVEQIIYGMFALGRLHESRHPQLGPLMEACTMERIENALVIEFTYPSAELFDLMKSHHDYDADIKEDSAPETQTEE